MPLNVVLRTTRLPFLILSPICVFLGISTALQTQSEINVFVAFLVMTGALSAHISVNTLNEYFDFKSGLDLKTVKTPFSGGSGALPVNPELANQVFKLGLLSLLLTITIGLYLVFVRGMLILPIGLLGLLIVISYTQWINRFPVLCLLASGLGFGILMVVGTHVVLTGEHDPLVWLVALVPFFLINNLLLLNQYPDIEADASVGRVTFPIAFGVVHSNRIYLIFALLAYAMILFLTLKGQIPPLSLIAVIPMAFSLFSILGARKHLADIADVPHYLGANVVAATLTPLLLGISLIYG